MRLARQEGKTHPLAAVEILGELTPYELAIQIAMEKVDPWGPQRDDMRDAWNTLNIISSTRSEAFTESEIKNLTRFLENYVFFKSQLEEG